LARVDLDPVLLAELLRALQDVLAKVALRALRCLVLLAAEGLRRLDLPRVLLADRLLGGDVEVRLLLRLLDDLGLDAGRVARLGPPRLQLVLQLLRGPRLLRDLAGRVAPDLLRRE